MAHTFKGIVMDLTGRKGTVVRGMSRDDTSSDDQRQTSVGVGEKEIKATVNEK